MPPGKRRLAQLAFFLALALPLLAFALAGSARAEPVPGAPAASPCPAGMLLVPGGTFAMGSVTAYPDEAPVHSVAVASYCLDRTEVTVAAYRRCVDEKRCSPPGTRARY